MLNEINSGFIENSGTSFRDGIINLLTYSFLIGGGWLFIRLLKQVATIFYPSLSPLYNLTPFQIFTYMFLKKITGLLFLLTLVRPFFTKEEITEFIKPDVPFISVILKKHIENMYS